MNQPLARIRRPRQSSHKLAAGAWVGVVGLLGACTPALDWRDVRPEGALVQLQMPCKPNGQSRDVNLGGGRVNLALHACAAGQLTWGLAAADMADPARVGPALAELAASAAGNLATPGVPLQPLAIAGATPNAASGLQRLSGRLPDGKPAQMQVAVFARGTWVYQASVLGEKIDEAAAQTYFASLRFSP
jgi:hypothetical protein